jgi:hypothetical protein
LIYAGTLRVALRDIKRQIRSGFTYGKVTRPEAG